MSTISNLSDLCIDELKDLWSANDQMARALTKMLPKATHPKQLRSTVKELYAADELMTERAQAAVNVDAALE